MGTATRLGTIFIVGSLIWSETVFSASFFNGNDLYAKCEANVGTTDRLICSSYIMGLADALALSETICMPRNAVSRQVVDIVRNYLRGHPESRQYSAPSEAAISLTKAFPCK